MLLSSIRWDNTEQWPQIVALDIKPDIKKKFPIRVAQHWNHVAHRGHRITNLGSFQDSTV